MRCNLTGQVQLDFELVWSNELVLCCAADELMRRSGSGGRRGRRSAQGYPRAWDPDCSLPHGGTATLYQTLKPHNSLLKATVLSTSSRLANVVRSLRPGGGQQNHGFTRWALTSRVIHKPGRRKEASASLIQHGRDDCLPLLSLSLLDYEFMHHLSSASLLWKSGVRRVTCASGHNGFLGGAWMVLPVKVVDGSGQFSFTHCHVIIWLSERLRCPLSLTMATYQWNSKASELGIS